MDPFRKFRLRRELTDQSVFLSSLRQVRRNYTVSACILSAGLHANSHMMPPVVNTHFYLLLRVQGIQRRILDSQRISIVSSSSFPTVLRRSESYESVGTTDIYSIDIRKE